MYKKQRIERTKNKLTKKKNSLLVELYKLKSQQTIREKAEKELGMKTLKPSQIRLIRGSDLDVSEKKL